MTKKKEKSEKVERPDVFICDHTKVLTKLKISAGYLPMLQQVLFWIIKDLEPDTIVEIYKKVEQLESKVQKGEDASEIELDELEGHVYTLNSLIKYFRWEAHEQGFMQKQEGLTPDDLGKVIQAMENEDLEKYNIEIEKLKKIMTPLS